MVEDAAAEVFAGGVNEVELDCAEQTYSEWMVV